MDLELESRHPQMAGNIRREMAIVQVAGSDLVAKVHGSFDNVMDRASSRFTQYARYVTFFNGLIITLFLQLDCLSMVNRLSLDDSLRASMVAQANQLTTAVQQAGSSPDANAVDNSYIDFLNRNGILWTPVSPHDWAQHWKWSRLSGILVSFLLINLGAPFWYNALKTLLRLRSAAEEKDDSQRARASGYSAAYDFPAAAAADPRDSGTRGGPCQRCRRGSGLTPLAPAGVRRFAVNSL